MRNYFDEFREAKAVNNQATIEKLYFELCNRLDLVDETGKQANCAAAEAAAERMNNRGKEGRKLF